MNSQTVIINKEMAVTHADFFRSLPNALRGEYFSIKDHIIFISSTSGTWTIELGPEDTRQIALLSLPKTRVKLKFENYSTTDLTNALTRFDRAFQRAGG